MDNYRVVGCTLSDGVLTVKIVTPAQQDSELAALRKENKTLRERYAAAYAALEDECEDSDVVDALIRAKALRSA